MWHRLVSLKISSDFESLVMVTRKRGRFKVRFPPSAEGWEASHLFHGQHAVAKVFQTDMSSAGVSIGKCLTTALTGFSDLG
jgi:hypothetical protein